MTLKRETTIPYISKRNGVPMTLLRSDDEIKAQLAQAQAGAAAPRQPGQAGIDPNAVIGAAQSGCQPDERSTRRLQAAPAAPRAALDQERPKGLDGRIYTGRSTTTSTACAPGAGHARRPAPDSPTCAA